MRRITHSQRSRILFSQIIAICMSFLLLFCLFVVYLVPRLITMYQSMTGNLATDCGCNEYLSFANNPWIFIGLSMSAIAVFFFIVVFCFQGLSMIRKTRMFLSLLLLTKKNSNSKKLQFVAEKLGVENVTCEVGDKHAGVFCYGFLKPKILISAQLVLTLSIPQLRSVLRHEQKHVLSRDPLKLFFVSWLEKSMGFIPGIRNILAEYRISLEVAADEFATNAFTHKRPLALALYTLLGIKEISNPVLCYFDSAIETRIEYLTTPIRSVDQRFFTTSTLRSLVFFVFGLLSLMFLFSSKQSALAGYDVGICEEIMSHGPDSCELSKPSSICDMSYGSQSSYCSPESGI